MVYRHKEQNKKYVSKHKISKASVISIKREISRLIRFQEYANKAKKEKLRSNNVNNDSKEISEVSKYDICKL